MKNLVMLVAAAIMGLSLAACDQPKKPEPAKVNVQVTQPVPAAEPAPAPVVQVAPAAPVEAAPVEAAPAQ